MHEWVVLILPTQTEYCAVYKKGLSCSTKELIEFFIVCTKVAEMAVLASKDLTTAKKVTSSGDAKDYYWFRSPMPNQLS